MSKNATVINVFILNKLDLQSGLHIPFYLSKLVSKLIAQSIPNTLCLG